MASWLGSSLPPSGWTGCEEEGAPPTTLSHARVLLALRALVLYRGAEGPVHAHAVDLVDPAHGRVREMYAVAVVQQRREVRPCGAQS